MSTATANSPLFTPGTPARIWRDVTLLLLIACFTPLGAALAAFVQMLGVQDPRVWTLLAYGELVLSFAKLIWLGWLVICRTVSYRRHHAWRVCQRWLAVAAGASAVLLSAPGAGHPYIQPAAATVSLAWLALEVCARHGITAHRLGIAAPEHRTHTSRVSAWEAGQSAMMVCVAGGGLATALASVMLYFDWGPVMQTSQLTAIGVTSPWQVIIAVPATVVLEDLVMVGATTALLSAARRPAWEIYTLICGLEVVAHLYMGLPGLGMLAFAAGRVYLYRRWHRLTPLAVAHACFDTLTLFLMPLPFLTVRVPVGIAIAVLVGLFERYVVNRRRTASEPATGPSEEPGASTPEQAHGEGSAKSELVPTGLDGRHETLSSVTSAPGGRDGRRG
ncbi:hypothetical protein OG285_32190 [Streptomyces sp. NBC_01471]|uniref:hypothetical protein n=1 Tax=Streptomyces sp. NBC_01471 TaxID=2903879 RepID=UPI00325466F7